MTLTASERFRRYLSGMEVDRAPIIEWAPWWDLTVKRWLEDGLPPEVANYEGLQGYFGLDKCLQTGITGFTSATPTAAEFGMGIMENEEDYENRIRPTLFPDPSTLFALGFFERLEQDRQRGDTLHFFTVNGFFWHPRDLFGIENHLYSFYDYPELYHRICDDHANWLIAVFRYVFSRFRFDFMSFAEDMSYNHGPMISKDLFDEFLAPYYRRVIPVVQEYGVPVFIDSDGDITQAVDWYASVGADGMFPLERNAGVDVSVYLSKQPQLAFMGHFDKLCMKEGEAAMREEFERLLPSMMRGKVVASVDHQTPPDVSLENYKIYVRLFKEYAARVTHADADIPACPVFAAND